jgi:signal transduction histidine kinase
MFIQIKATLIDERVIVFLNDITKIKELESTSYKVRSMFFSSVAHELRTPLNSIIPMTKILQSIITDVRS